MKVKIKDKMDNITLKCSFDEVKIIEYSLDYLLKLLKNYDTFCRYFVTDLNTKVFDFQEFSNCEEIKEKISKMKNKIEKKFSKIYVY